MDAPSDHDCCVECEKDWLGSCTPHPKDKAQTGIPPRGSSCVGCAPLSYIGDVICETTSSTNCKIDRARALLTIPTSRCKAVALSFQSELETQNPDKSEDDIESFLEDVGNDIVEAFKCLHYFYFVHEHGTNKNCNNLSDTEKDECNACTAGDPIFNLDGFTDTNQIVVLPAPQDRITDNGNAKGKFLLDERQDEFIEPGAAFITDVFGEYMECTVSIPSSFEI